MALSAAAMVVLIDEAIEYKLDPTKGDAFKSAADSAGISVESFGLDELRQLRREYAALVASEAGVVTGGLQLCKVTNVATSA